MSDACILGSDKRSERSEQASEKLGGFHCDDEQVCDSRRQVSIAVIRTTLRTTHVVKYDEQHLYGSDSAVRLMRLRKTRVWREYPYMK